ncbi:sensor histidine kinase [Bacillota bacterium Lsc_1132]
MDFIPRRFKHNGLFIFMFLISVIIIMIVSVAITWATVKMSEKFFIEKFSIMNKKIMIKIQGNFELFDNSVVIASNNLLQSRTVKKTLTENRSEAEKMTDYYNVIQKINYTKSLLDLNQMSILIMGKNRTVYAADRSYWPIKDEIIKDSIIVRNTLKQPKYLIYQFNKLPSNNPFEKDNENYIVASRALMDRISGTIYGSMYFAVSESQFRSLYSSDTSLGNNVFLVDREGTIVSSNMTNFIGHKNEGLLNMAQEIESSRQRYLVKKFDGKEQIMLVDYIPYFDWYLVNMIDKQKAIGDLINKKSIALIVIGIVIVALMIVFLASRRLTNSLSSLVKQIENVAKYDFHQYVLVAGTYETRQIGQAFNSMLDELHEYVDRLIAAQKQQRNAELAALQQQIKPHFLYNTLTSIKFMVHQGQTDELEETITALISLLQNTIGNTDEMVTVKQELDSVRNYVLINQRRYGNRIKVNYMAAPDCMNDLVPKLILQPFVENSFFHGFNRKTEGAIHILIWHEGKNLVCEVVDNGDGIELLSEGRLPETKRKHQRFSGIGVKNVHERIQLIYGEQYGIKIASMPGEGTKVQIKFPSERG